MKEYEVTAYYSEVVRVKAESENEAISKAQEHFNNIRSALIADNFEVEEVAD